MVVPCAIDIFSGAGGLSLGARWAGIDVLVAVECNQYASKTYAYNHPTTQVVCDDIHNINPHNLLHTKDPLFLVFGGPPCQGFSTSNTRTRNTQNPNNTLFEEFVRFVDCLKPVWFVFENVEGFVQFEKGETLRNVKNCFETLGYTVEYAVLTASDYGVPQNRHRFIMVGNINGVHYDFPKKCELKVSVWDAISDLPHLKNGEMKEVCPYSKALDSASEYARLMRKNSAKSVQNYVSRNADYVVERYRYISQGQNWQAIPEALMKNYANKNNCHSGIYKRLRADLPSIVISNYRKNMLIHPYEDRGLSVREAARLQSFPDDYVFQGPLMYIQQQIGNAVPPLLAKAVFDKILAYAR